LLKQCTIFLLLKVLRNGFGFVVMASGWICSS